VDLPQGLGHQCLDGRTDEVLAVVAEQHLAEVIDTTDHACVVHPCQSVRHSLMQAL